MLNRILIVGFFGYETNQLDGQTVKTRNIYQLLKDNNCQVDFYDTESFRKSRLSIFNLLYKALKNKNIIIIPAGNALKIIFPFLFIISKLFFKTLIFIPVGGWLSWYIKERKHLVYMLSNIKAILPQTQHEVEKLKQQYRMKNVYYFPNFRLTNFNTEITTSDVSNDGMKLLYFARIHKMKGLDIVFHIADKLIKNNLYNKISIDFYGQINEEDREYFLSNVERFDNVTYKGFLNPKDINMVLTKYDLLLFPTRWINDEGFPGSILDGYMAGLPVIASNWVHSKEFVKNGYSGYICDVNNSNSFYDKILFLYSNKSILAEMKKNALLESKKYSAQHAYTLLINFMDNSDLH